MYLCWCSCTWSPRGTCCSCRGILEFIDADPDPGSRTFFTRDCPASQRLLVLFITIYLNYVFVLAQLYVESTWDVLQLTRSGSTRENPFQRNASARGSSDKADIKLIPLQDLYGTYLYLYLLVDSQWPT
jgi:hypothetical protein